MGEFALRAPQVGEAVRKVGIVRYLKAVGQAVALDEPLVVVETDKATLEIESPVPGVVLEVLHDEGTAVEVGAVILMLRTATDESTATGVVASGGPATGVPSAPARAADPAPLRNGALSPRQRHQLRQAQLMQDETAASSHVSMPVSAQLRPPVRLPAAPAFTDSLLSAQRQQLNRALAASQGEVVAANLQLSCPDSPLQTLRRHYRQQAVAPVPSRLELIAWAVVQAMKEHPLICSRLLDGGVLRRHWDPGLGLAVALPHDELAITVVPRVFTAEFTTFTTACREAIAGAPFATEPPPYHPIILSDLSAYGIEEAVPVVVAPSTATLFIGMPRRDAGGELSFRLSLSFDHRVLNGAGAATFLNTVSRTLRSEARLRALVAAPAACSDAATAC